MGVHPVLIFKKNKNRTTSSGSQPSISKNPQTPSTAPQIPNQLLNNHQYDLLIANKHYKLVT